MLVETKEFLEDDGSTGYYECIFKSSNILGTTYFPKINMLYISFGRGTVYSYRNVTMEFYNEFLDAESHGEFFQKNIAKNPNKYPYRKEYTLYPEEIRGLKEKVNKNEVKDDEPDLSGEEPDIENLLKRLKNQ